MKKTLKITFLLICCMLTLVAVLSACDFLPPSNTTITVTFDPNYEGAQVITKTGNPNSAFNAPSVNREGYNLDGWYKSKELSGKPQAFPVTLSKNTTFYAKWSSKGTGSDTKPDPVPDPNAPTLVDILVEEHFGGDVAVGQIIYKENFTVTAIYSDDSSKRVDDFKFTPAVLESVGKQTITVSYTEGKVTKSKDVTVYVIDPNAVLEYITAEYVGEDLHIGDEINKSDIIVTAFYSDDRREPVTEFNVGPYDTSTLGMKLVTVYVLREGDSDLVDYITVNVVAQLNHIEVQYTGGDLLVDLAIDETEVIVTAFYDDDSSKIVRGFTLSETSFATTGEKTVTVTYVESGVTKTNTFTVNVVTSKLERIKAVYNGGMVLIGEQPNVKYLKVTAYYENGLSKVVTNVNVGTIESATEGEKDWEVSYTDNGVTQSAIVKITVTASKEPRERDYDVEVIKNENLSIHFLELGNQYTGDSVYIKAGDVDILIDAGSREDSAATISRYVNQYCTDGILEYVIVTHAHQDHIAGFVGNSNQGIFDLYECKNIIEFARTNSNSNIYKRYLSKRNAEVAAGANLYTALDCTENRNGAQKVYDLTGDGAITMEILYQKYYVDYTSNENNYSVCLMISQGDNHYLFTGDLEDDGETSLVNSNPNLPEVELWKGGHHGSYTAANATLMAKIQPKCVCVCTCMGTSEYTTSKHAFPAQEFCDRVAPYTDKVYVTTYMENYDAGIYRSANGNIVFACTNGQITMYFSGNNVKLKDTEWFKANRTMPSAWR